MSETRLGWDFSERQDEILLEIPRRLASLNPRLILLFGSRATGHAAADSDYDLLVVTTLAAGHGSRTAPIRRLLRGLGVPFDIVVYTPEQWEQFRLHPQSLAWGLARTGKVLHESR